jgi:hypothetical protein
MGARITLPKFKVSSSVQYGRFGRFGKPLSQKTITMYNLNYMPSLDGGEIKTVTVQHVLEHIKKGTWEKKIVLIRQAIDESDQVKADELKRNLPAFTVSATFKERRKKENIDTYSGLLHLDYDKVEDVESLKESIIRIPYTYSAFISPSGKGLKVMIKTDAVLKNHTEAFNELRAYYDGIVGFESDKSVKDVTRLCFVSYDPSLYLNEASENYSHTDLSANSLVNISWVWNFTTNKMDFIEGQRNNFMHLFACNANRFDIDINETRRFAINYACNSFTFNEIEKTIKSAYENNVNEKGRFAKPAISAKTILIKEDNPFIPETVYTYLPQTLKEACNVFTGRERDVFLTSALSVLSGGFYNVQGYYSNEAVFPNLFSFVVAPPASGKGSMKYAKQLGDCYHNFLLNESKEALKKYKKEKLLFDRKLRKAKTDQEIDELIEPQPPKVNVFFIPADTSSSMLIKHLEDNDGLGCICETETDTISNALSKEWGGYSDILRKGFHAEMISKSRVKDLEYCEITDPKFSLTITGTPNQMDSLITSIEDGLFSRFLFYSFTSEPIWNATYTFKITNSKKEIFSNFSSVLCDKFKSSEKQIFYMTEKQGKELDKRFSDALKHNTTNYSDSVSGITFRLGLMTFKIAMVLSALRSNESEIYCSNEDFDTAMCLVEKVYMPHSINMLNKYEKSNTSLTVVEQKLLEWMPDDRNFMRAEISEEAMKLEISDRTLSDILKKFINLNQIKKIKNGLYART